MCCQDFEIGNHNDINTKNDFIETLKSKKLKENTNEYKERKGFVLEIIKEMYEGIKKIITKLKKQKSFGK